MGDLAHFRGQLASGLEGHHELVPHVPQRLLLTPRRSYYNLLHSIVHVLFVSLSYVMFVDSSSYSEVCQSV